MNDFLRLENRHTGEVLRMCRARDAEGQVVLLIEGFLPPGRRGPPLHIHLEEREEGVVTAGTLGMQVGGVKSLVQAGESAVFPPGIVHKWWNAGDGLLKLNGRAVPVVDLDRYLQAMFAVINASPLGRPSIFYLAHVAQRHRHTQTVKVLPTAVQRIIFPLVVVIGRIQGKYKGDSWPGSPASCKGAPMVEVANA